MSAARSITLTVPWNVAVATFMLLNVALMWVVTPRISHFLLVTRYYSEHEYTYIGTDHPMRLPINLPTSYHALGSGEPGFSLYADDDWATLFPASDGFTDLGPQNRTFLVSMVHQLHCLDVFRVGFVTNRTGYAHHVEHCLRYMLQMVLCNADATLEADEPGMRDGRLEHAAGGIGSVRECKDWTVLRKYLDEHPAGPAHL